MGKKIVHDVLNATVWQAGSHLARTLRQFSTGFSKGSSRQQDQEVHWQKCSMTGMAHTCRDSHSITATLYSFCRCCTAASCCCWAAAISTSLRVLTSSVILWYSSSLRLQVQCTCLCKALACHGGSIHSCVTAGNSSTECSLECCHSVGKQ